MKAPKKKLVSYGVIGFFFTLRVYTHNTQNFVENSKMGEKHTQKFDPQPDLHVRPWLIGA